MADEKPKAAKPKAEPKAKVTDSKITVKDLATEFGMTPRVVRLALRSAGNRARTAGTTGPGAYTWAPGDPTLVKVRALLKARLAEPEPAAV